jgi:GntR family transcriptional regulator, transcriptional repressor for pyruvate dehydrogenase complex
MQTELPLRRFRVSDVVAAHIEQLILTGQYKPGQTLPPEKVIAADLGVSRGAARAALRLLERRHLVKATPGTGIIVGEDGREDLTTAGTLLALEDSTVPELVEARLAIEPDAAAAAALRITPTEAEELERILLKLFDWMLSQDEYVQADLELHTAIARASKNRLLFRAFENLEHLFLAYSRRVVMLPERREKANIGHKEIIEAIHKRRPRAAREAMEKHLRLAEQDILDFLETQR